jgi:hypothetical protein
MAGRLARSSANAKPAVRVRQIPNLKLIPANLLPRYRQLAGANEATFKKAAEALGWESAT